MFLEKNLILTPFPQIKWAYLSPTESKIALFLARGEAYFPSPYHLLEIKTLFQMVVFNISDYVMCPAQKGSHSRWATKVRKQMKS